MISKSKYDNLLGAKFWTFVSRFPMTDLFWSPWGKLHTKSKIHKLVIFSNENWAEFSIENSIFPKLHFGDLGGFCVGSSIPFVERSLKGLFTPTMLSRLVVGYIEIDDPNSLYLSPNNIIWLASTIHCLFQVNSHLT